MKTLYILAIIIIFNSCDTKRPESNKNDSIKTDTLIDSATGVKFILDMDRIHVSAIDKSEKQLWRTDPIVDAKLGEYRVKKAVIVYFDFGIDEADNNKQVISIGYNNSRFGHLNKITGKFHFLGQD